MTGKEEILVAGHPADNNNLPSTPQETMPATPQEPLQIPQDLLHSLKLSISNITNYLSPNSNDGASTGPSIRISSTHTSLLSTLALLQAKCKAISVLSSLVPAFPKFKKLPKELRLMIWRCAGDEGQVIGIRTKVVNGDLNITGTDARCPLLLTCKESRKEVLKSKQNFCLGSPGAPKIYVNFEVDTIWYQDCAYKYKDFPRRLGLIGRERGTGIQRLAIDCRGLTHPAYDVNLFRFDPEVEWVYGMDLKELILVVDSPKTPTRDAHLRLLNPQTDFQSFTRRSGNSSRVSSMFKNLSWEELAVKVGERLERLRVPRQNRFINTVRYHGRNLGILESIGVRDVSQWVAPQIRFMDVVSSARGGN